MAAAKRPPAKRAPAKKPAAKPATPIEQDVSSKLTRMFGVVRALVIEWAEGGEYRLPLTGRILRECEDQVEPNELAFVTVARLLKRRWELDRDERGKLTPDEITDLFVSIVPVYVEPPTEPGEEPTLGDAMLDPTEGGGAP